MDKIKFKGPELFKNKALFQKEFYLSSFWKPVYKNGDMICNGWFCSVCIFQVFFQDRDRCPLPTSTTDTR